MFYTPSVSAPKSESSMGPDVSPGCTTRPHWHTMDEPDTQGMEFSARLPHPIELPEPVNANQTSETSGDKEDTALEAV